MSNPSDHPFAGLRRVRAVHPHWQGFLLLDGSSDVAIHEGPNTRGRYELSGDRLEVVWEGFEADIFFEIDGEFVDVRIMASLLRQQSDHDSPSPRDAAISFLFIRGNDDRNEALHRLQSDVLMSGLRSLNCHVDLHVKGSQVEDRAFDFVVFHYNDGYAVKAAHALKSRLNCRAICLGSDIYGMDDYVRLDVFVDTFTVPTELHGLVLRAALGRKVVCLPDGIDSIARPATGEHRPVESTDAVFWFGYPESFWKSFEFIWDRAIAKARFDLRMFSIVSSGSSRIIDGVRHIPFDAETFYEDVSGLNYALTSHFAFDLRLNSIIKSPNKMVTALVRGTIPLFSATPSYQDLAKEYGLESLGFRDSDQLAQLLVSRDFDRDVRRFGLDDIRRDLLRDLSPARIAARLLASIV